MSTRNTVKLELTISGHRVVLGDRDCRRLLPALAALGDDCSPTCKRVRAELGTALVQGDTAPASKALKGLYELLKVRDFAANVTGTPTTA